MDRLQQTPARSLCADPPVVDPAGEADGVQMIEERHALFA
jgi:hypothetical protein